MRVVRVRERERERERERGRERKGKIVKRNDSKVGKENKSRGKNRMVGERTTDQLCKLWGVRERCELRQSLLQVQANAKDGR